jgi:hypothetical protein
MRHRLEIRRAIGMRRLCHRLPDLVFQTLALDQHALAKDKDEQTKALDGGRAAAQEHETEFGFELEKTK